MAEVGFPEFPDDSDFANPTDPINRSLSGLDPVDLLNDIRFFRHCQLLVAVGLHGRHQLPPVPPPTVVETPPHHHQRQNEPGCRYRASKPAAASTVRNDPDLQKSR